MVVVVVVVRSRRKRKRRNKALYGGSILWYSRSKSMGLFLEDALTQGGRVARNNNGRIIHSSR